jgi:hypothetical protein
MNGKTLKGKDSPVASQSAVDEEELESNLYAGMVEDNTSGDDVVDVDDVCSSGLVMTQ